MNPLYYIRQCFHKDAYQCGRVAGATAGLKKANPYKSDPDLTAQDRLLWKSVLHWCDECDERARSYIDNGSGRVFVYPLKETEYLVEVDCFLTNQQFEALFYKVKEHGDTIER